MNAAVIDEREDREASTGVVLDPQVSALDAGLLDAHRTLLAETGGTPVLRTNAIVCRAPKGSGTVTTFALSNAAGM